MRHRVLFSFCAVASLIAAACDNVNNSLQNGFLNFETIPTRALAQSADGSRLFALNVPDGRLEILQVGPLGLTPLSSVSVGLDPIALAVRNANEVWVVNHLSDSVSIVDANPPEKARVVRTLLVGDEPRDIVFAGPGRNRAFITAARRGQNHPVDTANLTQVPGQPRADVWVFDATNPGNALGGTPLTIVPLFSDKPGSLAATADGSQVYVSVFTSGNRTSVIMGESSCGTNNRLGRQGTQGSVQGAGPCMRPDGGVAPGGTPAPNANFVDGLPNPRHGIIVTNNRSTGAWLDVVGRDWRDAVQLELPDNDVFVLNANQNPPRQSGVFSGVGTLNFNIAIAPDGMPFVANIEAINQNRFISLPGMGLGPNPDRLRGAPISADPTSGRTLRGHLYESRISILGPGNQVRSRHLNKHINYEAFPTPPGTLERSIAQPQAITFSRDGSILYVAGLGSNKVVPYNRQQLINDSFVPDASTHIQLLGNGGPADLVLDSTNANRMFVYKRFDNAVAIVNISQRRETTSLALFNPEPASVRVGRRFFYDATLTSDNGEANCSVCHPSADKDDLAWNLGAPFLGESPNPNQFVGGIAIGINGGNNPRVGFNPLKGPMTVLTLRGIKDSGPMFWRGDATNDTNPLDERMNFMLNFPIVFDALNGKTGGIPAAQFEQLTNWILTLVPPPNPHRPLDNSLNSSQMMGMGTFTGQGPGAQAVTDVIFQCMSCHALDPSMGQFGTQGMMSTEGETQFFKVTQLRTVYDKVGMFGASSFVASPLPLGGPRVNVGPQVKGFGTLHDGSLAGAEEFLTSDVFQLTQQSLLNVVNFTYAFPSNVAPIMGQQVTLRQGSGADTIARIDLMQRRAAVAYPTPDSNTNGATNECDLVAKGVVGNAQRGYLFQPQSSNFLSDTGQTVSVAQLRQQAQQPGQAVTFTCVYAGGGRRIGIDRDLDGTLDGNE